MAARSARPADLTTECVYAIIDPERFRAAQQTGEALEEGKPWSAARRLLEAARPAGLSVPVVFADARNIVRLLFWSRLESVVIEGKSTRFVVGPACKIDGVRSPQNLRLRDGHHIAPGFIRSYALCRTPSFLLDEQVRPPVAEATRPLPSGVEGELLFGERQHRKREGLLRRAKIDDVLRRGGRLSCAVSGCGFDFESTYGELGAGFAIVHHLDPIGTGRIRETTLADLAIVCANCHAMIHLGGRTRELEEIGEAMVRRRKPR